MKSACWKLISDGIFDDMQGLGRKRKRNALLGERPVDAKIDVLVCISVDQVLPAIDVVDDLKTQREVPVFLEVGTIESQVGVGIDDALNDLGDTLEFASGRAVFDTEDELAGDGEGTEL